MQNWGEIYRYYFRRHFRWEARFVKLLFYLALVIGGQKIDVEKFDGKINFGMWRRKVMDAFIQIDLDVVLKNKRHMYDEEI